MSEGAARTIALALALYAAAGFAFAAVFVVWGVVRVDRSTRDVPWTFRLLILPGSAALWPLLLLRWIRAKGEPPPAHDSHRDHARRRA
jgi:hypothetical protein